VQIRASRSVFAVLNAIRIGTACELNKAFGLWEKKMGKPGVGKIMGLIMLMFLFQACSNTVKNTAELRENERELVRSTIDDPERAARLISLLDQRDQLVNKHIEMVSRYRKQMQKLNADYATDRQTFEKVIAEFDMERIRGQQLLLELTTAMKKQTSAEEWKEIAKYQVKNLDSRQLSYQQKAQGV
jgi:hypothetical protein